MKKQIGIWIDYKHAHLITLNGDQSMIEIIASEVEDYHPKGGSRSKTPYGPMEKISEKKYLERRKNQIGKYFNKVMKMVEYADEIFIMGPAGAKVGLRNKMIKTSLFRPYIKGFKSMDSITENQKVAETKAFFENKINVA
ncbi:MAG: hypothetical protein AB8H03_07930 [Saprospiraceae bacterium]